jgi:hypothetical protein
MKRICMVLGMVALLTGCDTVSESAFNFKACTTLIALARTQQDSMFVRNARPQEGAYACATYLREAGNAQILGTK